MNSRKVAIICMIGIFLCSGCASKKRLLRGLEVSKSKVLGQTSEEEARLIDIPFPFDVKTRKINLIESSKVNKAQTAVSFETTLSTGEVGEFYRLEMERLGWKELCNFDDSLGSLVVFEKPHKYAVVSIRFFKRRISVRCFVSAK